MLRHYLWSKHAVFCCGVSCANLDAYLLEILEDFSKKIRGLLVQPFLRIGTFPFAEPDRNIQNEIGIVVALTGMDSITNRDLLSPYYRVKFLDGIYTWHIIASFVLDPMSIHVAVVVSNEFCQPTVALPLSFVPLHYGPIPIGSLEIGSQYHRAKIFAMASDDVC